MSISSTEGNSNDSSSSSSKSDPDQTQCNHRLTIRIPTSNPEEVSAGSGEIIAPNSHLQFPALQVTTTSSMMQAVTSSVSYASQMEADTATSATVTWTSRSRERWS